MKKWIILNKGKKVREVEEEFQIETYIDEYFPIVRASKLSLKDKFLKHKPQTDRQEKFKNMLVEAIESGLYDFRAQRMDPSFDKEGKICYGKGMKPAIRRDCCWWDVKAMNFMPDMNSRLGTTKERIAFLGVLIKDLIKKQGYTISEAWEAVCDQSEKLGNYGGNTLPEFERTGSRQVGEWYDLGNTRKITVDETDRYFRFGGSYMSDGSEYPLASMFECHVYSDCYETTAWIVLSV